MVAIGILYIMSQRRLQYIYFSIYNESTTFTIAFYLTLYNQPRLLSLLTTFTITEVVWKANRGKRKLRNDLNRY